MANFKETITKAIGNSKLFNEAADFMSETQKRFKAQQALDDAKAKLAKLFDELGRTSYYEKPLTPGRTCTVICTDISITLIDIENLEKAYVDVTASEPKEKVNCETETSEPEGEVTPEPEGEAKTE